MISRPVFAHHFNVKIVKREEAVYLLSEKGHFVLTGHIYTLLAPLLDGSMKKEEIAGRLASEFSTAEVLYVLSLLEEKGYIVEAEDRLSKGISSFLSLLGVDISSAIKRLEMCRVSVKAIGEVSSDAFEAALRSLGIATFDKGNFFVLLTDDYLQKDIERFNLQAIESKRPWMLCKPVGAVVWIGPIFLPGVTSCWECLSQRLRGNREVEATVERALGLKEALRLSISNVPTVFQTAVDMAATEIFKWIVCGKNPVLEEHVVTLNTTNLHIEKHRLIRRPQCPVCGTPVPRPVQEFRFPNLQPREKIFCESGGYRVCRPDETVEKYRYHISPITGVVNSLQEAFRSGNGLVTLYCAGYHANRNHATLAELRTSLKSKGAGKGKTDAQCRASGLCEAIERYSSQYFGDEMRLKSTFYNLGSSGVHPNECMRFSEAQYRNRDEWNRKFGFSNPIPQPFDPDAEIEWAPVWSLNRREVRYLPMAYCYYGYRGDRGADFCVIDSSGNAAGNVIEEAIIQGFMELVERDCVSLWWYNRLKRPRLGLSSFRDPYLDKLIQYYRKISRDLWVLDITNDFGIPAFAAVSRTIGEESEAIIMGFGAHFDPSVALLRAVTELNQYLYLSIVAKGLKGKRPFNMEFSQWLNEATIHDHPYLCPDESHPALRCEDFPFQSESNLLDDIERCIEIVDRLRTELLVLDQTRPDIGMSVVKVFVPGLYHFRGRFAPSRLYDVPVRMGWLRTPFSEADLNPIPFLM